MNLNEFQNYLEKFDIKPEIITNYLKNKKILEINSNLFLNQNSFKQNEVFNDSLIFIKLKNGLMPSIYLLNFIKNNSKNILTLKSDKHKVNFTYGKSLSQDSITKSNKLKYIENNYYILLCENIILGIAQYNLKDKKFPLENKFNIGEYLKEN